MAAQAVDHAAVFGEREALARVRWARELTSAAAFEAAPGGFYDRPLAEKAVRHLSSPCNSLDPAEAYRAFRGRDAAIDAPMRDRGFPVPGR